MASGCSPDRRRDRRGRCFVLSWAAESPANPLQPSPMAVGGVGAAPPAANPSTAWGLCSAVPSILPRSFPVGWTEMNFGGCSFVGESKPCTFRDTQSISDVVQLCQQRLHPEAHVCRQASRTFQAANVTCPLGPRCRAIIRRPPGGGSCESFTLPPREVHVGAASAGEAFGELGGARPVQGLVAPGDWSLSCRSESSCDDSASRGPSASPCCCKCSGEGGGGQPWDRIMKLRLGCGTCCGGGGS